MSKENPKNLRAWQSLALYIRIIGLGFIFAALILTREHSQAWLFRSHNLPESLETPLVILRIAAGAFGILLLLAGGILGRKWDNFWNPLPPSRKLIILSIGCIAGVMFLYALSSLFRWNAVPGEWITPSRRKFQLFGFTVLLHKDEFGTLDYFTSIAMTLSSLVCFAMYAFQKWIHPARERCFSSKSGMWLLFGIGTFWLALDEYYGIHEFLGINCQPYFGVRIAGHSFDLTMVYFLFAIILFIRYRHFLLSYRPALYTMALGVILHGLSTVIDITFAYEYIEESGETIGAVLYLFALIQYAYSEVMPEASSG